MFYETRDLPGMHNGHSRLISDFADAQSELRLGINREEAP
jgi:hypothetical protein